MSTTSRVAAELIVQLTAEVSGLKRGLMEADSAWAQAVVMTKERVAQIDKLQSEADSYSHLARGQAAKEQLDQLKMTMAAELSAVEQGGAERLAAWKQAEADVIASERTHQAELKGIWEQGARDMVATTSQVVAGEKAELAERATLWENSARIQIESERAVAAAEAEVMSQRAEIWARGTRDMASQIAMTKQLAAEQAAAARATVGASTVAAEAQVSSASKVGSIASKLHNVGMGLTTGLTVPLIAIGAASVYMAAQFQTSTIRLNTQAGASISQMNRLRSGMLSMAGEVGAAPTALASGMYHVVSSMNAVLPAATRTTQELQILKAAAEGARVGGTDLEETSYALASAMNALHEHGDDAQKTMGMLNAIVGAGDMTMKDLIESFKSGLIPGANSAGLSLQSVGAAMAVMGDMGMRGALAGTRLRMSIALLSSPSMVAAKVLDTLGMSSKQAVSTSQAMSKALADAGLRTTTMSADLRKPDGLMVALKDLNSHLVASGMTATGAAAVMNKAFGGGRMGATITLLAENTDRLNLKFKQIGATTGKFGADFAATQQTTSYKFHAAEALIEADLIRLGNVVTPLATKAMDDFGTAIDDVSGFFEGLSPSEKTMAVHIAELVTVAGPAILAMGLFGRAIQGSMMGLSAGADMLKLVTGGMIDLTGSDDAETTAVLANTVAQEALTVALTERLAATEALAAGNAISGGESVAGGFVGRASGLAVPAAADTGEVVAGSGAAALGADAAGAAALAPETAGLSLIAAGALAAAAAYVIFHKSSTVTMADINNMKGGVDAAAQSYKNLHIQAEKPIKSPMGPNPKNAVTPTNHAMATAGENLSSATMLAGTDVLEQAYSKIAGERSNIIQQDAAFRAALGTSVGADSPGSGVISSYKQMLSFLDKEKQGYLDAYNAHKIGSKEFLADEAKVDGYIKQVTDAQSKQNAALDAVKAKAAAAQTAYISAMVAAGAAINAVSGDINAIPSGATFELTLDAELTGNQKAVQIVMGTPMGGQTSAGPPAIGNNASKAVSPKKKATGGWLKASDGAIGTHTSDSNLAWLSRDEAVIPADRALANADLVNALIGGGPLPGHHKGKKVRKKKLTTAQEIAAANVDITGAGVRADNGLSALQSRLNGDQTALQNAEGTYITADNQYLSFVSQYDKLDSEIKDKQQKYDKMPGKTDAEKKAKSNARASLDKLKTDRTTAKSNEDRYKQQLDTATSARQSIADEIVGLQQQIATLKGSGTTGDDIQGWLADYQKTKALSESQMLAKLAVDSIGVDPNNMTADQSSIIGSDKSNLQNFYSGEVSDLQAAVTNPAAYGLDADAQTAVAGALQQAASNQSSYISTASTTSNSDLTNAELAQQTSIAQNNAADLQASQAQYSVLAGSGDIGGGGKNAMQAAQGNTYVFQSTVPYTHQQASSLADAVSNAQLSNNTVARVTPSIIKTGT